MAMRTSLHGWLWPAAMAAAGALLGLVAVVSPPLALAGAAGMAFVSLAVADLTIGIALFAFIALLEVLPGVGALSVAKLAGGVLVLSWIAASASSSTMRRQLASAHPGFVVLAALLLIWVTLGLLWAESPAAVLGSLIRYVPNLLLFPILYAAVGTGRDIRVILTAFTLGALISTAYGAFIAPGDLDAAAEGRVSGAGVDPNDLAASLVAGLVLCGGVVLTRAYSAARRMTALVVIGTLFFALVVTASRTGMVALLGACLTAVFVAGPGRRLPAAIIVVAALGLGAGYIGYAAPVRVRERLQEVGDGGSGRTDIWKVAARVVEAHPIKGVGADNFPVVSVHYLLQPGTVRRADLIIDNPKVAHNVYLGVWAELGIVGLALFLAIVGFSLRCELRAARAFRAAGDRPMELLSRSVLVATAGVLCAALFISIGYNKSTWLLLAIGPCLLKVSRASPVPTSEDGEHAA